MTTNLFDLSDKLALVTGASRGIGEAAARLLAEQGAHVIISSRKQDACEKVAREIQDDGGQASAHACHIGDLDQIQKIFNHVREQYGRLDILVNNAAANPYYGHITETDVGAFDKTVKVYIQSPKAPSLI